MGTEILHRLRRTREQAHTLSRLARTLRAETLGLQGQLLERHFALLQWRPYYRFGLDLKNRHTEG